MKTSKRILKCFALLISCLVFFSSCSVYHRSTCSVDEAIKNNSKVKIRIDNTDPYELKRLERLDGVVYGVTGTQSQTYKRFRNRVTDRDYEGKYALIPMQEEELQNIHEKNLGASTALSIGVPVAALGITAAIVASTSTVSIDSGLGGI